MKIQRTFIALLISTFTLLAATNAQVGRGRFGFGLSAGPALLQSDLKTNDLSYGASADISYALGSGWGLKSSLGFDSYSGKDYSNQSILSTVFRGDLTVTYDFVPREPFNPFVYGGGGLMFFYPRIDNGASLISGKNQPWSPYLVGGLGIDYFINESWSLMLTAEGTSLFTDRVDGISAGVNDSFMRFSIGIRYYLFDRSTVEKIVKMVE